MKAIRSSRRFLGAVKAETIILILAIAAYGWWQYDHNEKERKRKEAERLANILAELTKSKLAVPSTTGIAVAPKAEDDESRGYVGHKARVVHPGYFTELGGVPASDSIEGAAAFTFSELASAMPGAELHPNEFTKMGLRGPNVAFSKVTFLPVTTEFEIIEAYRPSSQMVFGHPLILKARAAGLEREFYYINAKCLTPVAPR